MTRAQLPCSLSAPLLRAQSPLARWPLRRRNTLNLKVFKRMGFQLNKEEIDSLANCASQAVERTLKKLQVSAAAARQPRRRTKRARRPRPDSTAPTLSR